jgi:hypothetical protein
MYCFLEIVKLREGIVSTKDGEREILWVYTKEYSKDGIHIPSERITIWNPELYDKITPGMKIYHRIVWPDDEELPNYPVRSLVRKISHISERTVITEHGERTILDVLTEEMIYDNIVFPTVKSTYWDEENFENIQVGDRAFQKIFWPE